MNLKDKKILVTGASSGIGQSIAIELAKKGAEIFILYFKHHDGAKHTLSEVEKHSKGYIFQADLRDISQVERLFSEIKEKAGEIDILVNDAGDARGGDFFDNEKWKYEFDSILFTAVHATQNFLKQNENSPLRKILNISSYYGEQRGGNPGFLAYSAAKAAMNSMTITLAKSVPNVLINAIAPGYVWTPPWAASNIPQEELKADEEELLINRFIRPEEIAHMSVAVLENDAITGEVIVVDGGLSIKGTK